MEYKGYDARVTFDDEAGILHGEVAGIRDVVTFQGQSVTELRGAFQESIDDYIRFCKERGKTPETPYSGEIPLKLSPELHRAAAKAAQAEGKTLNAWLADIIKKMADSP